MCISCNNASTVNNRQQNLLFNCVMLIPIHSKGRIIGKNGSTIKEISRSCKTSIHIDTNVINYPRKEVAVTISGTPVQCTRTMSKILHLVRLTHRQYPLKIKVDSKYMPHVIGKKGKFLRQIKHVSRASLVKLFPVLPEHEKNGVLIIKDRRIYNCLIAAEKALIKIYTIQTFQLNKFQAKRKTFIPNQNIRQATAFMAEKIKDNTRKQENKRSKSIQIDVIEKKNVDNTAAKTINNQKTAIKASEISTMKPQIYEKYSQTSPSMTNNDVLVSLNASKIETNYVQLNLSSKNSNTNQKLTEIGFASQFLKPNSVEKLINLFEKSR